MADEVLIRKGVIADLPALGRLGALLLRTHYEFDPQRFITAEDNAEEGYAWFLGTQLRRAGVAIFVAERGREVIGYVYAGIEPHSWKELRDEAGFIHDIVVDERGRRTGVASALIARAIEWLREQGMPRVMLWTADRNEAARRLFTAAGFRRTMIEMTRELL